MVNPDGKVGLKVRAGAHHPERTAPARDRAARPFRPRPTLPADRPSSPVPRPHPPQITRRLIAKLDGEEPASRPAPEPAQTSTSAPTAPVGPRRGSPSGRSSLPPTPRRETLPPSPTTAPCSRASTTPSRGVSEWANSS